MAKLACEAEKSARKDAKTRCKRSAGTESPKFESGRRDVLHTGHVEAESFAE